MKTVAARLVEHGKPPRVTELDVAGVTLAHSDQAGPRGTEAVGGLWVARSRRRD